MKKFFCKNTQIWVRVSKKGNVRRGIKSLSLWKDNNGYPYFQVKFQGKRDSHRIHRVLAELYIPNPHNLPFVNHKDGDKSNYRLSNLEWSSEAENTQHAVRTGLVVNCTRKGESHAACKYPFATIQQIRAVHATGSSTIGRLAQDFKMDRGFISRIVNLKTRVDA